MPSYSYTIHEVRDSEVCALVCAIPVDKYRNTSVLHTVLTIMTEIVDLRADILTV